MARFSLDRPLFDMGGDGCLSAAVSGTSLRAARALYYALRYLARSSQVGACSQVGLLCWLWWGLGPHLTAHADWLVCSDRLPRVLLLAGGAGKEGPASVLRHTALLQNPDCMGPLCVSVYGVLLQWRAGARVCCSIGIGRADLTCSTCSQALLCGLSCSCE
jgi:hypothetical protein